MESTAATVMQAQKAILSVTEAHNALADELKDGRFDSTKIAVALQNIERVHKNFSDLEELIKNCETEIVVDGGKGIICKPASKVAKLIAVA
jgi:hypothetical protein